MYSIILHLCPKGVVGMPAFDVSDRGTGIRTVYLVVLSLLIQRLLVFYAPQTIRLVVLVPALGISAESRRNA